MTFGKPLIENQAIQWMIADSDTELYAARAMCYDAAKRVDAGEDVFREISMAKLYCTEMVGRVVDRAVQIFGGHRLHARHDGRAPLPAGAGHAHRRRQLARSSA